MLTIDVFDEIDLHFEQALRPLKRRFSKATRKAAIACAYKRAINAEDHKSYTLILCPDASELSACDQTSLRAAEQQAARRLGNGGRVLLAFGDSAAGRACCARILRLAERAPQCPGETP